MYYFRINDDGQWKDLKLDGPETTKVAQATAVQRFKLLSLVKKVAAALEKKGSLDFTPSEAEMLAVFRGVANEATYSSIAIDFIRGQLTKKTAGNSEKQPA